MSSGAVILELAGQPKGVPISWTVADSVAVEKGTLMALSGGTVKTAKASTSAAGATTGEIFVGIAATEKKADDGDTTLGLWTKGTFDIISAAETITEGDFVVLSGANIVGSAPSNIVASKRPIGNLVGMALEAGTTSAATAVAIGIY